MAASELPRAATTDPRAGRRSALGPPLQVHRLRADRGRDRRRSGEAEDGVNLAQSLLAACERHPELEAFPSLTYGELLSRVQRIAGGLDVEPGDRVAIVLDNRLETPLLLWACWWAGAVAVPLSWRLSDDELDYCIGDCGARRVVREGSRFRTGRSTRELSTATTRETALMLYTSGTTGRPKGVPRSHRADRAGGLSQALQHGYCWGDRTLGVMPLYHTMGGPLPDRHASRRRLLRAAGALERGRGARPDRAGAHHLALPGADALPRPRPPPAARRARRLLGACSRLRRSRDDVEPRSPLPGGVRARTCSSTTTARPRSTHSRSDATSPGSPAAPGRSAVNSRLRLTEEGEVCVHLSSDEAFSGYWNRPDADAKAIRDGWYHTGDTGHLDEDGDLWVDGRLDDMIVSGGENIHPLEVEDVLAGHPACARWRSSARRTSASVSAWSQSSSATSREAGARRALPRLDRSPASSARASTASSTPCRRALWEDPPAGDPRRAADRTKEHA